MIRESRYVSVTEVLSRYHAAHPGALRRVGRAARRYAEDPQ